MKKDIDFVEAICYNKTIVNAINRNLEEKTMRIKIGQFDVTECWDGVFYKKLSHYPNITTWEIQTVLDFIKYEESYGRVCKIEAERQTSHR